jgi:hypothetical protein
LAAAERRSWRISGFAGRQTEGRMEFLVLMVVSLVLAVLIVLARGGR